MSLKKRNYMKDIKKAQQTLVRLEMAELKFKSLIYKIKNLK